jgi:hypothetical protein
MNGSRVNARARTHGDRAGDPLDGLVNLFDLAIVLSVAFLLAALSSLKLTALLGQKNVTVVRNPGSPSQTLIVKKGEKLHVVHLGSQNVTGQGVKVGSVYRLSDGRLVYVTGKSGK